MAVVRIRGLPYSARADDIVDFFKDVKVKGGKRGIFFPQGPNGRSNGEAFIELESNDEIEKAVAHHNEHMGRRYIEVFPSSKQDMNASMGRNDQFSRNRREYVVRLRGLPYDTEKKEIYAFFNGLEIAPNGIGLLVDHMGRCTGEAYVQFTSAEMLARAKEKHMEKIGHRYIEIFESSMLEANSTIQRQMEANQSRTGGPMMGRGGREHFPGGGGYYGGPKGPYGGPPNGPPNGPGYGRGPPGGRPGPYDRPHPYGNPGYHSPPRGMGDSMSPMGLGSRSGYGAMSNPEPEDPQSMTGHSIRLRGLPYSATMEEVDRFLAPLQPVNIRMRLNPAGRPTGEAMVDFASHDEAKEAMKKDREKIGSRYIELFLASTPMGKGSSRMGGSQHGSRSYGPPGSPPYSSGRSAHSGSHMADNIPYGTGSDYGGMYGPEDMSYGFGPMGGPEYNGMVRDEYYGGSNGMGPMGPSGDSYHGYRSPYRQGNYHW